MHTSPAPGQQSAQGLCSLDGGRGVDAAFVRLSISIGARRVRSAGDGEDGEKASGRVGATMHDAMIRRKRPR